jgi:hypothetical protein
MKTWEKYVAETVKAHWGKYFKFSNLSKETQEYVLESIKKDADNANDSEGFERKTIENPVEIANHGVYTKTGTLIISYWNE